MLVFQKHSKTVSNLSIHRGSESHLNFFPGGSAVKTSEKAESQIKSDEVNVQDNDEGEGVEEEENANFEDDDEIQDVN